MTETRSYIKNLFTVKAVVIDNTRQQLFEEFVQDSANTSAVKIIIEQQKHLVDGWIIKNQIADIIALKISLPNATAGRPYQAIIDLLNDDYLVIEECQGLEEIGLKFNKDSHIIEGIPTQSGELRFKLIFKINGQTGCSKPNEKSISLIVNPDPKTLWKDIPSNKEAIFWKVDDADVSESLGEKHIVVASKRGRSHENEGSFRDDDFAFKYIEAIGWSIVAVSDGAGSSSLSRQGSHLACSSVVDYFENHLEKESFLELEHHLLKYEAIKDENLLKEIEVISKQNLYKSVLFAHHQIKELAEETQKTNPDLFNSRKVKSSIEYFHSTLIFALFKKFNFGYVIMTFGVGDCPIALMNKEQTETTLLNWLDVGEFGGGTRFITQPDIFHSKEYPMVSRFNFKIISDFSYLFLMTDGIYDPKFVVEANLEKHDKWTDFLTDLEGKNDENIKVRLSPENVEIARQLSDWMDFWSPGNHDDRTLAIIF